jgi:hypothetical protein
VSLEDHKILALTVHRPWSELIARGLKTVETRGWAPPPWMLGRYLAIHASTRWDQEGAEFIERAHSRFLAPRLLVNECPAGIIAVAQLVGWVQRVDIGDRPPKVIAMLPGHAFGGDDWRWFHANEFGWVLRGVKRIAPVAARGQQKLWAMSKPVYDSVRARYAA